MSNIAKTSVQFQIPDLSKLCRPVNDSQARKDIDVILIDVVALAQDLRTQRNVLAPINRLPTELLSKIFAHHVSSENRCITSWLPQVAHICHHWRSIAHGYARIWSYIYNPPNVKALNMMLTLSKGSLVTIKCTSSTFSTHFLTITPDFDIMRRIQNIRIVIPESSFNELADRFKEPASYLQVLELTHKGEFLNKKEMPWNAFAGKTPRLHTLKLKYFRLPQDPLLLPGISESLTCLELEHTSRCMSPLSAIKLLGCLPNLQRLVMHHLVDPGQADIIQPLSIIHLPCLSYLSLQDDSDKSWCTILRKLVFPMSTILRFSFSASHSNSSTIFPLVVPNFLALSEGRQFGADYRAGRLEIRVGNSGDRKSSFVLVFRYTLYPSVILNASLWAAISQSLTSLEIREKAAVPVSDMLVFLGGFPELQRLKLKLWGTVVPMNGDVLPPMPTVHFPRLSSFTFYGPNDSSNLLLQHIVFPVTTVLDLKFTQTSSAESLTAIPSVVSNFAALTGRPKLEIELLEKQFRLYESGDKKMSLMLTSRHDLQTSTIVSLVMLVESIHIQTLILQPLMADILWTTFLKNFMQVETLILRPGKGMRSFLSSLSVEEPPDGTIDILLLPKLQTIEVLLQDSSSMGELLSCLTNRHKHHATLHELRLSRDPRHTFHIPEECVESMKRFVDHVSFI